MATNTTNYSLVKPAPTDRVDVTVLDADLDVIDTALGLSRGGAKNVKAYGAVGDGVADDTTAIQNALNAVTTPGSVVMPDTYLITTTLLVPSHATIDGCGTGSIVKGASSSYKMIRNKDGIAGSNTGITIRNIALTGAPSVGTEYDAGIHLTSCSNSLIENVSITDVRGDGITFGNIVGNTVQTVTNSTIRNCVISGAGRQGVALTDADGCWVLDNKISNVATGAGVDLETNFSGQPCKRNTVSGNNISSCLAGVYASSVGSVSLADGSSNRIVNNVITNVTLEGIKYTYSAGAIGGNMIDSCGHEGIYVTQSGQVTGLQVFNNVIRDAGQTTDATYSGIRANNCVYSSFNGNVFQTTGSPVILKLWTEDGTSGYNQYMGNNGRQVVVAYTIASTSDAGHNILNSSAVQNRHGGFYAMGTIDLNAQNLSSTGPFILADNAQTVSTPGAVTIAATHGDAKITLTAAATSTTITGTTAGRTMTITWVQDSSGGHTYAWPTNCKFAGGVAPSDTTLSTRTSVRFKCDGTNWYELSRAVAVA